ncbi:UDP-N-acetylmuramoyl-L-alanyl-D-glutamate--2,6-diaminopimelate ligase [soil metagenome]
MRLGELCAALPDAQVPEAATQLSVRAVQSDSRVVEPGDLFVAVPGTEEDSRQHARQAVERGAIVVVSETSLEVAVPLVLVSDARLALARLAAAAVGNPADQLQLVGITGTLGKTSVLSMLAEILRAAGIATGSIGSLGIEHGASDTATSNTTPGALELQRALSEMVAAGTRVLAMEVTSHALTQGRVHGLTYDVGIFTNLTMLEHLEYHASFRAYVDAKRLFLKHLRPSAPLIFPAGDRAVSQMVRAHGGPLISCGGTPGAVVSVRRHRLGVAGTRISLSVRRALPGPDGRTIPPHAFPLELATLGRTNVNNAVLATVAALCLGAEAAAAQSALASLQPPRRRLQIIRREGPCIIDDTVGHPDSITGVFEVAERIPHRRLHVVFCIRGQRGPVINERDAEALAIWSRRVPVHRFISTSAVDTADERNTVTAGERDAFLRVITSAGLPHTHHDRLEDAIDAALDGCGHRDLLLLLGAQGMDTGAAIIANAHRSRGAAPA